MWIVRLALRRPYTFVVLSLLIFLLGIGSAIEAPKDIFPYINIPVVTIVWTYSGLTPTEMEGRVVTVCERALTTTVNDIEHTESESYQGVSVIRVYFQPTVKVELAALADHRHRADHPARPAARNLPAQHPQVRRLLACRSCSSRSRGEGPQRGRPLRPRPQLHPAAAGERQGRLRSPALRRQGAADHGRHRPEPAVRASTSPRPTSRTAINQQNLILPAGTARIGDREFVVKLNSSPGEVSALNDLPIRAANGAVVYIKDVAQVREGYAVQTNIVRAERQTRPRC